MIKKDQVVSIEYEVKSEDGQTIDSNLGGKALEFLVGSGQIIPGLESALLDCNIGDSKQVKVEPKDGYGDYIDTATQKVNIDEFKGIELKEGMTLFGQSEDGQTTQVIVKSIEQDSVIIDFNHPLAGKTLLFDVKILDVRDATEMEIIQGGAGGGGCCGHDGGGCCGEHKGEDHSCGCGH